MRETTHRRNGLLCDVGFCGSASFVVFRTHSVNFLVELGTVVVTVYGKGRVNFRNNKGRI